MIEVPFKELAFIDRKDEIQAVFLRNYRFILKKEDLEGFGLVKVEKHALFFTEKSAERKLSRLIEEGFKGLIGPNNRRTIYLHQGLQIPLLGSNVMGIVDRGTNVLEIKPMTGCNLSCPFCSVDEGVLSGKVIDFLVEESFLVQEFERWAKTKKFPVEAHIAGQCEPLLYPQIVQLVKDVKAISGVAEITIDTNGLLLTEKLVDELVDAGLTRIDLSLHSLDPVLANKLAGGEYDVAHVVKMARYATKKLRLLLAPVFLPGVNDGEIERLILLSKELHCLVGIQNFLEYDQGRLAVKSVSMEVFFEKLRGWEKKFSVDLSLKGVFDMRLDTSIPKTMKKGDRVSVRLISPGKYPGEMLGVSHDRLVTVYGDATEKKKDVRVKIIREKHNIYKGVLL